MRPTHITCAMCDAVDEVNRCGTVSTRCRECRVARRRHRQRACDGCQTTYWPPAINSVLCDVCVAVKRAWVRPTHVACVDCGVTITIDPRGKIRKRCLDCAPRASRPPVATCETCGERCRPNRRRRFSYCDECVETGKAKRDTSLRTNYGITLRQYDGLWEVQGGCCGICEKDLLTVHAICTDHDHDTSEVRGILCHHCNRALGAFGDNLEGIRKAARYLERPPMSDIS